MELLVEENVENFSQLNKSEEDIVATLLKYNVNFSAIIFDCEPYGPHLENNRLLHRQLLENNISHDYEEQLNCNIWL